MVTETQLLGSSGTSPTGNIIPGADATYTIGTPDKRYLGIYAVLVVMAAALIGSSQLETDEFGLNLNNSLFVNGSINATGNITGAYFTGDGGGLTNLGTVSANARIGGGDYLYNDSTKIYLNETQLNLTIDDRAIGGGITAAEFDNATINRSISLDDYTTSAEFDNATINRSIDLSSYLTALSNFFDQFFTDTDIDDYVRDNSILNKDNSTIIAEIMQNDTINRSISLDGYLTAISNFFSSFWNKGNATQHLEDNSYLNKNNLSDISRYVNLTINRSDDDTQVYGDGIYLYKVGLTKELAFNETKLNNTIGNYTDGLGSGNAGIWTNDTTTNTAKYDGNVNATGNASFGMGNMSLDIYFNGSSWIVNTTTWPIHFTGVLTSG